MTNEKPDKPKRPDWALDPAEVVAAVPRCPACGNLFLRSDEDECQRCRAKEVDDG